MYVLNYLYFLTITLLALQYLKTKGRKVINPLDEKQKIIFSGSELFWTLTFSTGLLAFSAPAGLDLMALRLFALEGLCLLCLLSIKNRPIWSLPALLYLVFLLWLTVGLLYTPAATYGIRVILKYLYPLLILLTASAVIRNPEVFLKSSRGARLVALVSIIISFIPYLGGLVFPGVFWYGTGRAINYISMCMFSLAIFCCGGHNKKDFWYAVLFAAPCLLWVLRTSIMGTIVALMCFAFFKHKLKSLPVIAGIIALGISSIFLIPAVKEKMFNNQDVSFADFSEGKLSKDSVNSNARFAMWEYFENKFYRGTEIIGSGTGTCQQHFYNNYLFGGLKVMHSDIVQMKCDNGLIGLFLYYASIILIIFHSFRVFSSKKQTPWIRICALTAGSSMAGVAVTMYSDNVVNYSMCTLSYPFGFYGMMLGLLKAKKQNCAS